MVNPFISKDDYFKAETYNGAAVLWSLGNPEIIMDLPVDYDGLAFVEGLQKVAFILVNLILTNTVISNNKIQLAPGQTTGTVRFRIYPNVEPLKIWNYISFVTTKTTGTITCDIYKGGNHTTQGTTLVKSNISNPEDLTDDNLVCEYVDFVFTLTEVSSDRPTLNSLELKLTGGI